MPDVTPPRPPSPLTARRARRRARRTALGALLLAAAASVDGVAGTAHAQGRPADPPRAGGGAPSVPAGAARLGEAPLDTPLPFDAAVRRGTLPNGVRYYIRRNTQPAARAELRLVVDAGSVLEDSTQRGLAHLVEHMAFNGTARYEKQALVRYLEASGTRFGADLNAATSFDETIYELTVPTDSAALLDRGLDILAQWAHAVTFDSAEVERERPVVIEEWRQGQGAGARVRDRQFPTIFAGSPYATRLPIGTLESLRTFRQADLRRFYRDWYRPELMTVVVVGEVEPAAIERRLRELFAPLPRRPDAPARTTAAVPAHDSVRVALAADPELTGTSVSVLWLRAPDSLRTIGDFRRALVAGLASAMLNARFGELAQRPDAPFLGAGGGAGSIVRARGAFSLGAGVADTGVVRGLTALLAEAERARRFGFTAPELERARRDLVRQAEVAAAEAGKTPSAAYAGAYVGAALEGDPVLDAASSLVLHERLLPGITLADVDAQLDAWLASSDRIILASGPGRVPLPEADTLRTVLARVETAPLAAWTDRAADGPLVAEPPAPGRVVQTITHPAVGVVEWRLANGARVLVKPTDFRNDEVLFRAWSPGGSSLVPDSLATSAAMAASIVQLGGVGALDRVQLEKALAGVAADVGPSIGTLEEGLSGYAAPADLPTLLQLAHLYMTAPRADSAAFLALRQRMLPALENRSRSPESAFADTLQVTLAQHHPRMRPLTPAFVDQLDFEAALAIYRERFADADDFTFAFVGNVDADSLRPLVEQWLGSLPSRPGAPERWRDLGIRPPEGVVRRVVRRGQEPKARTQLVFARPAEWSREAAARLGVLQEVLEIRLRDLLREELGGTYGVSVDGGLQRDPVGYASVSVGFGGAPERIDELTARLLAAVDSLRAAPPTAEELETVRTLRRRERETALRQNGWWLGRLAAADRLGEPFAALLDDEARLAAVTPAEVQDAARRYLDPAHYVQVTLLPESAPAAEGR